MKDYQVLNENQICISTKENTKIWIEKEYLKTNKIINTLTKRLIKNKDKLSIPEIKNIQSIISNCNNLH